MVQDAERIQRFVAPHTRESFRNDDQAVVAACYGFVRLGEAATHIPQSVITANPQVEWGAIRHFRNFMIHVYPAVDPGHLYDTAKTDLPPLVKKLQAVLDADLASSRALNNPSAG